MAGSKTLIPTVLVYNYIIEAPKWVTLSEGARMEQANAGWEIIDPEDPSWEYYATAAGQRPERYTEEVIQPKEE